MHRAIAILLSAAAWLPANAPALSSADAQLQAALRLTPDLQRGAEQFQTCAACHGVQGEGASDGSVPAIAGQHTSVILEQLIDFRRNARLNIRMQHFVDHHHLTNVQELANVAAYVNSLNPPPPKRLVADSSVAQGESFYTRLCASCHGAAAQGDANARVPRLAGQHPEYTRQQLSDALEGRRPNMEPDHAQLLAHAEPSDLAAVATFILRLGFNDSDSQR
ncbi:MAG TPA: c-type cytochrome [Steroidobacteraceae bacterium]|nr:c-type cytochrome [Steroidobacteraceae bacterium]